MATQKRYRVRLVNTQTLGAMCGHGEGETLQDAQKKALEMARQRDPEARLSDGGYQVFFAGGINC